MESLDYWKFVAGLGFFLYGMSRLEDAMREIAGKRFKLFLKKYTTNRLLAVVNGIVATAILQSSSVVLLMVIAFAGAGIISLSNSLGIILGANLGTTLTGWVVRTFGFGTNLESFVYPLIGIGSLGLIFASRRLRFYHAFGFLTAVGFLFMGLSFMKESMLQLSEVVDIGRLQELGPGAYFLFGLFVTAVVQSSSAMMMIVLSAMFAGLLPLEAAAGVVVGADLGTTVTGLLASFRGTPVKKRVGLAHFFFNVVTVSVALLSLQPLLHFVRTWLGIEDHMYALVAFHSAFNLIGIVLFFPFLGTFEKFLSRFFAGKGMTETAFINKVGTEVPEAALEAVQSELRRFIRMVLIFDSKVIGFSMEDERDGEPPLLRFFIDGEDVSAEYRTIKKIEGELLAYFAALQNEKLDQPEALRLHASLLGLRNGVQSAKSVKDVQHNLKEFRQSVNEKVEEMMREIHLAYGPVHRRMTALWETAGPGPSERELTEIGVENKTAYERVNRWIYGLASASEQDGVEIATFLNVNREIFSAFLYLTEAYEDVFFAPE